MLNPNELRKMNIYQVFVRNYSQKHSFKALEDDLKRIHDLGMNILYLMPIFELGQLNKKGTYGSPYAIKDYLKIDPFLGTLDDLKSLIAKTHQMGMKIILDMVLNHTSCDNVLLKNEDYYLHIDGKISRKCTDWSDVIDLDYHNLDMRKEIIDICKYYVNLGFDGFRMDVCSLIPIDFWQELKAELVKINQDIIMIGESCDISFYEYILNKYHVGSSDKELYQVFDCLYQYNIRPSFDEMAYHHKFKNYLEDVKALQADLRLRYLENHDIKRIAPYYLKDIRPIWALNAFLPGLAFYYMGSEFKALKTPNLFEFDPIKKESKDDLSSLIKELSALRDNEIFVLGKFDYKLITDKIIYLEYRHQNKVLSAIFNFSNKDYLDVKKRDFKVFKEEICKH